LNNYRVIIERLWAVSPHIFANCCSVALRTLRPQDISAPIFGAKVSRTVRHRCRSVFRHFGTGTEMSQDTSGRCGAGQQQAKRTQTCPCGPTRSGPCPAALPHYASCAAFVGRRHKRYYCRWCCRSRLDYGYATLAGLPGNQIDRLQSVMNAAARLVWSVRKYEHITPLLRDLHWLQVPERIEFKLSVLVFRCLHGTALPYLATEPRRVVDVSGGAPIGAGGVMTPHFLRQRGTRGT